MASEAAETESAEDDGLIFRWKHRSRPHWRLALMLAASLLVHAGSFYVLQVAYTPTGTQLPPPAQVVVVPLDQPENAPLARWLAMNDPALTRRPSAPAVGQVLESLRFHYVPSYNAGQPPFKSLDPAGNPVNTAPPRASLPGPVPMPLPAVVPRPQTPDFGAKTRVVLTGSIGVDADVALPPVKFVASDSANVLNPTVFLVGPRPEGGEPFLFRQSPSGNTAADEYARRYLAGLRWQPVAGDNLAIGWGYASFYWGNDVYR